MMKCYMKELSPVPPASRIPSSTAPILDYRTMSGLSGEALKEAAHTGTRAKTSCRQGRSKRWEALVENPRRKPWSETLVSGGLDRLCVYKGRS